LAAGDGRRLHGLTTNEFGVAVPKQFCSLRGGESLLRDALRRAEAITHPRRICTIVAEQHRRWWGPALGSRPSPNVIVQPRNRGTAHGILLPLLHILRRDPEAHVVLLPSDHHIEDEHVLARALRGAVRYAYARSGVILLLGISPDRPDPDLGYIVPGDKVAPRLLAVSRFVEKPRAVVAQKLIHHGALWNAFILAARGTALLELFQSRRPELVKSMRAAIAQDQGTPDDPAAMTALYQGLCDIDFSRHVLEGAESRLRVVSVPRCGWSDLGTPTRLAETLQRLPPRDIASDAHPDLVGYLNLAAQHARRQAAVGAPAAK
jgi:mannose-1-phosphate guanylyltransferase